MNGGRGCLETNPEKGARYMSTPTTTPRLDLPDTGTLDIDKQTQAIDDKLQALKADAGKPPDPGQGSVSAKLAAFGAVVQNLQGVLPGVAAGALMAKTGFNNGDPFTGSAGVMDAIAAFAPLVGAVIGGIVGSIVPVVGTGAGAGVGTIIGALIGSVFSMIAEIVGYFAPQAQSQAVQVSTEVKKLRAEDRLIDIWSVHNAITIYANSLNDVCNGIASARYTPRVMTEIIRGLNPIEGNTMKAYWGVIGWLGQKKSQELSEWPIILNAACNAYALLLMSIVRLRCIVSIDPAHSPDLAAWLLEADRIADPQKKEEVKKRLAEQWDELVDVANAKLISFGWCNQIQLKDLRDLAQAARDHGSLWRVGDKNYELRAGLIEPYALNNLNNNAHKMSVAVRATDLTNPFPVYQVYLVAGDNRLHHRSVQFDEKTNKAQLLSAGPVNSGGTDLVDVFAIPGTDPGKDEVYVYELSSRQLTDKERGASEKRGAKWKNKIVGNSRDAKDKPTGVLYAREWDASERITSVRVVYDPYSYADDPVGNTLKGIESIVYALYETDQAIFVSLSPTSVSHVSAPFTNTVKGIAVDQDYLWVFSETEFACATHASVVRKVKGGEDIAWMKSTRIPHASGLMSFYPCDDGTLVASAKDASTKDPNDSNSREGIHVYSATYRTNLRRGTIEVSPWRYIPGDHAKWGLEKLPVFCWPQFEGLVDALEALEPVLSPAGSLGNVWGIKTTGELYRHDGKRFNHISSNFKSIAVHGLQVWGIKDNQEVCRWNGERFEIVPNRVKGTPDMIESLAVSDREVWAIDNKGVVLKYSWFENRFVPNPGGGILTSIAAGDREVFGFQGKQIYRLNGNDWLLVKFDGEPKSIVCDRETWMLDAAQSPYRWNGATKQFEKKSQLLVSIATGGDEVWGLDQEGKAYRWDGKEFKVPEAAARLVQIAVVNGEIWGINIHGTAYRWDGTVFKAIPGTLGFATLNGPLNYKVFPAAPVYKLAA
jgi:hypothetical protein